MLKRLSSLLVLLLLLPGLLYSDISLTEEEYQTIMTALTNSEKELLLQEKTISSLEKELTGLKKLQEISVNITSQQELNYGQLKTYLKQQEKEQKVKRFRAFVYGAAVGVTGLYILNTLE